MCLVVLFVYFSWKIRPRMLKNVAKRSIATEVLGHLISFPVCIAPTAMHKMAHSEGEVATAKGVWLYTCIQCIYTDRFSRWDSVRHRDAFWHPGAKNCDVAFTLSTIATSSIEDIASGVPDVVRFFQLYIYKDRDVTMQLLRRAERNGFKALILTVDTPFFGKRRADNRNKFKLPPHLK